MLDFVSGFWNKEDNNFPRGATGVKTILKKKFEDGEFENATEEDIEHVFSVIEKLDPSGNISRIKQLAGLGSHGDSRLPMKKLVMSMQESVIDSMKTFINKINKDQ
jgi:hypothetical protein